MLWLLAGQKGVFDIHTMLFAATAIVIGFQTVLFAVFAKVFAISEGLLPEDKQFENYFRYVKLETGLLVGLVVLMFGFGESFYAVYLWQQRGFGNLDPFKMMRIVIPAVTCLAMGVQIIFASFFLSLLGLRRR